MPRLKSANNAESTIVAAIAPSDTSFAVADASSFPNAPFRVSINGEIMEIGSLDRPTNTFSSVLRGIEGTAAANHAAGTAIQNRFTAGTYSELESSADAQQKADQAESDAIAGSKDYINSLGLGAEPEILANANSTAATTAFYVVDETTLNVPTQSGALINILRRARPVQIYLDYATNYMWTRTYTAAGWTAWRQMLNTATGIRSQSTDQKFQGKEETITFSGASAASKTIIFDSAFQNTSYKLFAIPGNTVGGVACTVYRVSRAASSATIYFATINGSAITGDLPFLWGAIG